METTWRFVYIRHRIIVAAGDSNNFGRAKMFLVLLSKIDAHTWFELKCWTGHQATTRFKHNDTTKQYIIRFESICYKYHPRLGNRSGSVGNTFTFGVVEGRRPGHRFEVRTLLRTFLYTIETLVRA